MGKLIKKSSQLNMPISSRLEKLKENNLKNVPKIKNRRRENVGLKEFIYNINPATEQNRNNRKRCEICSKLKSAFIVNLNIFHDFFYCFYF